MISEQLEIIIQNAFDLARKKKHEFLTLEHLLYELCKDEEIITFLKEKKVNLELVKKDVSTFINKKMENIVVNEKIKPVPSVSFERVLKRAAQHVQSSGKGEVKSLNILVAMFSENESYAVYFLEKQNLSRLDVVSYISHGKEKRYNSDSEKLSNEINQSDEHKAFAEKFRSWRLQNEAR